ncbi:MAG: peptide ABC transporter permease [Anaerolineaceae bacterium]|nr:peptide ABC transporter permease [Anaerolineaceae bacterium]
MTSPTSNQVAVLSADDGLTEPITMRRRFIRAFASNRVAVFGLIIVTIIIFAAAFAEVIAPHDPNKISAMNRLVAPNSEYLLGTDEFGRDILSRLIHGARISMLIAFIAQSVAITIGISLGLISGWFGGIVDDIIMRITDAVFAIPGLMFLIVWVAIIDQAQIGLFSALEGIGLSTRHVSIFFALGLIGWASDARMMRSQVLTIKEREYVIAAKATGATNIQIMVRHLLPNAIAPSIVLASLGVAGAILSESTLSFLGLGVEIPNASWGTMVDQGRNFFTNAWWYAIFPGATIMITVLGFNFVGDGLRDALDPRLLK